MSMVILIVFAILYFGSILGAAVWFLFLNKFLQKRYRFNEDKAWVHLANGSGYEPAIKGQRTKDNAAYYQKYEYIYLGKLRVVKCMPEYPIVPEGNRRMIYAQLGTEWARTLPGKEKIDYIESEKVARMFDDGTVALYNSYKKKTILSLKLILIMVVIVALVVAAIVLVPKFMNKNKAAGTTPNGQVTTTLPSIVTSPVVR